jgi:RhoGAP domain
VGRASCICRRNMQLGVWLCQLAFALQHNILSSMVGGYPSSHLALTDERLGTTTSGVFRISGSHNVVGSLYNHYSSMDENGEAIAGTVRCPTLPEHIRCDVYDVASAFKKFISGLPGGILGSLPLFDSLISIQNKLQSDPERTRTKQSKIRARLIALAISTLQSQYRRELICAVFGLLCMIGRAAEIARREDDKGRPLPTSDLMGYRPLGIVFGPLLVGDLLQEYTMRIADPHGGLILLPISPPKSRKERKKKTRSGDEGSSFNTYVDKIKVANSIAEMLITHWREVVRHMKNLSALKVVGVSTSFASRGVKTPFLRPSASESFTIRKPPDWDGANPFRPVMRSPSPTPIRRKSAQDWNGLLKIANPKPLQVSVVLGRTLMGISPQDRTMACRLESKGQSSSHCQCSASLPPSQ